MARLRNVSYGEKAVGVSFDASRQEYDFLKTGDEHFVILPAESLDESFTIGSLGNSYRLMLSKKMLARKGVKETDLPKSAQGSIFKFGKDKFLVVRLDSRARAPHERKAVE
jgi:hypothetical protein